MRIYPLKIYLLTPIIFLLSFLNLFLIFLAFCWIIFQIKNTGEQIFLHYNILFGVDRIGDWWQIFSLPLLAFSLFLVNAFIAWFFYSRDKIISYFLLISSLIINIFVFLASILLVFINS